MRTPKEIMDICMDFAVHDNRIRLVTLEGSRTNKNIRPDRFQDFDVSYFVTDMKSFQKTDKWLDAFGKIMMIQKPEDMELFPPELGNWYSYILLFEDGNKLDLTLIPLNEVGNYFSNSDGLVEILLDKDSLIQEKVTASDKKYWIKKPTAREFDDCCNEFWMVSTYVGKGLARKEILFAIDHLNEIMRPNLLRMMSWKIGEDHGYHFSLGKNYKFIQRYLSKEDWKALLSTYAGDSYEKVWQSLFTCYQLFRKYSQAVAQSLGYHYPEYDRAVSMYTTKMYKDNY
jgi:aminoglycoside 6-adenylyltransferase